MTEGGEPMHSIRFKITAITIAAILTTILSVFAACYTTIQAENDRRSVEIMNLINVDAQESLEKHFKSIEQSVELVSNLALDTLDSVVLAECGAVGSAAHEGRSPEQSARLDAYLSEYCAVIQKEFESVASHTYGVVTYYYCINPDVSETEHGFFYSKVGKSGFAEQEPLDARTLDPEDIEHTVWYYLPIERGRPSWVGPYTAHFLGEMWICSYLVPIYNSGELIGVMGMGIPVETLAKQVRPIQVYETGYASLFDAEGRAIYHPTLAVGETPDRLGLTVNGELLQGKDSGSKLIRYAENGEKRQMSFSTMRNGMKVVVTAPAREINAAWTRLARALLVSSVLVIAVFVVLVMLVMRLITDPLLRLTAASRRLAAADYDVELDYHSRDEVGELTASFQRMRDSIKSYIEDLNRRVYTDSLTGLPNMRRFFQLAETERDRMVNLGKEPAMLYFDLIGMKHYNRQYGFSEGDKLLCEIGKILANQYDQCLCRFSEDHFAAVTDASEVASGLETVFRQCEAANGGNSLPMRVGVYHNSTEQVSVSVACDRAKYACGKQRDSYVSGYYVFDEDMLKQLEDGRYIISHLDQALAEHWIRVCYQPIIRTVNGRVCDEEALSRWIDPVRGFMSPGVFIPVLEQAHLIYKLDLYVLDQILEKMKAQQAAGLSVVPHSLNISRADFDSCDIVEEIRRRVDASGLGRDRLTIEVTESMVGSDFDFMKQQVERFQELGFCVWMDDFGSGYSALDVLQDIHFDLLKFDMRFMHRFDEGEQSRIILTELVRMAIALGIETVCEGVETKEQADFLREIGCTKLQGFYYCKPLPYEEILERYRTGRQIGFENPLESDYLSAIGRVNLLDLAVLADNAQDEHRSYFDMLPVGIMEVSETGVSFVRTNQAYRDFLKRYFGHDLSAQYTGYSARPDNTAATFMDLVRQCCESGSRIVFDGKLADGSKSHVIIKRVGTNPVTGVTAVAVSVLSVTRADEVTTFADIARALAADYYNIYVVELDTEHFIEYSSTVGGEELSLKRHGERFFAEARQDTLTRIYERDRDAFLSVFTKENVVRELDEQGVFTLTYRLIDTGEPVYVSMKVTRVMGGDRIIIGISVVDAQMKQRELLKSLQTERDALARAMALSEDYLCLYSIDPKSGRYVEYSVTDEYESLGLAKEGADFFAQSVTNAKQAICPDDLSEFLRSFTKENILDQIRENGVYKLNYRLMVHGEARPVSLKIAPLKEAGEDRLVAGVRAWRIRRQDA